MPDPELQRDAASEHLLIRLRQIVGEADPTAQRWDVSVQPAADQQLARERVLKDLLRDALRPMIERWLDQNLEGVVARVVDEELARSMRLSDETDTQNFAAVVVSLMRRRRPR